MGRLGTVDAAGGIIRFNDRSVAASQVHVDGLIESMARLVAVTWRLELSVPKVSPV